MESFGRAYVTWLVERHELLLLSALLSAFVLTVELTYDNISIKTLLCNIGVFLGRKT